MLSIFVLSFNAPGTLPNQRPACYNPNMQLSALGEFNLINQLAEITQRCRQPQVASWQNLILGIGDDAAVWKNENNLTLATTDCLVENVHFTLETTNWHDLGWKALAINLSDIAAMGGLPRYALVTLGLPKETHTEDVLQLYTGMSELAEKYGTAIVGGDVSAAPAIFINITIIGQANKHVLARNMARSGEVIAVTGNLGSAAGGLKLLHSHHQSSGEENVLCEAFLKPIPRLEIGTLLVGEGVHCAIDISDGLVADLEHICQQSGVGAEIEIARIPQAPELTTFFDAGALDLALSGGEDYELLFTAPSENMDQIIAKSPCQITVIGTITAKNPGHIRLLAPDGQDIAISNRGWQHFASQA